jgi:hypothetical protein
VADNVVEFLIKGDTSSAVKAFGSIDDVLGKVTKGLTAVGVAMAAVEFVKFIGRQIEVADQMGKMALKSGVAVESFSQMAHAFSLSEVSAEELTSGFKFLNKSISEATSGNDAARISFESIGLSMKDLKTNSPDEIMLRLADAFVQIDDPAARTTMLLEKFGRAGLQLAPSLAEGRAGIEKLMKQADKLGLTVDKDFAQAADRFGDSMQTVGAAVDGGGRQLGKMLLPILNETIEAMFSFGDSGQESILPWGKITVGIVGAVASVMLSLMTIVRTVTTSVSTAFQNTGELIGASAAAIEQALSGDVSGALDTLGAGWDSIQNNSQKALDHIESDVLKTGAAINKMNDYVESYGQKVTDAGAKQEEASKKPGLNPISKETATRLETTRKAVESFLSDMAKAEATLTGNKIALMDAEYAHQVKTINDMGATEKQRSEMLSALNRTDSAARVALHDDMVAQLGIADEEYRARQIELANQQAGYMMAAGLSEVQARKYVDSLLLEQQLAYLTAKNTAISDDYLTTAELVAAQDEIELARIALAQSQGLINAEQAAAARYQLAVAAEAKLGGFMASARANQLALDKMTFDQKLEYQKNNLDQMAGLMSSGNKTAFKIGKAAAIAAATINTYQAVSSGLATAPFFPVGIAMGAAALALGVAQIQKISSTNFSGQAHDGMTNVPRTGSYILQGGERVVQRDQNKDLTNFLAGSGGGDGGGGVQIGSVSIAITVPNGEGLRNMTRREWEDVVNDRIIPAFNALDRKGIRPDSVQRYAR